jgi:hypothetical protein
MVTPLEVALPLIICVGLDETAWVVGKVAEIPLQQSRGEGRFRIVGTISFRVVSYEARFCETRWLLLSFFVDYVQDVKFLFLERNVSQIRGCHCCCACVGRYMSITHGAVYITRVFLLLICLGLLGGSRHPLGGGPQLWSCELRKGQDTGRWFV